MIQFKATAALLLSLVSWTSRAAAQLPGTFTATGSMTTPRVGHTATLLTNGKVLIAGGGQAADPVQPYPYPQRALASAELYDPSSGTFTRTGDMATPRIGHTATLLPDGRVLIAGGSTTVNDALASAEIYDPVSGTFAPTGQMIQGRAFHTAILLPSGQVLLAGGQRNPPFMAELYDPSIGSFTTLGPLPVYPFGLTLLADGNVLVQGIDEADFIMGYCDTAGCRFHAGLFEPVTGAFRFAGEPINDWMTIVTATLLPTGNVLDALLATDESWPTDVAELYDPSIETFGTGKMAAFRRWATATLLPDATVLIAGGGDTDLGWSNQDTTGAELYDPVADKFSRAGSMAENREGHTATLLPDGTVLVAGGGINEYGTASAGIYLPKALIPPPVLYSLSGDGRGQGAVWHAMTGQIASASNPAIAGEALSMYTTSLVDGGVIPPQVAVGGRLAEILSFGHAPGYPGYYQVNFRMPGGVAPGSAVPVRLTYIGRPSNQVTIGVQ